MAQIIDISKNYLTSSIALVDQVRSSYNPINTPKLEKLQEEIDLFVREKLSSQPLPEAVKGEVTRDAETSLKILQECKAFQLSQDWLSQKMIHGRLNLACPGVLPVGCGATRHPMSPCIGFYDTEEYRMSISLATIRLHPAQLTNIPESVIHAIGDVKGKKVDYLLSVENISYIKELIEKRKLPLQFNLATHGWAHRHYQEGKDLTEMVSMGIYEAEGVYPIQTSDGVSFNAQGVLPVHCHPKDSAIAFSPNNAHIGISGNTPFSSHWSLLKLGDRIIVTKQVLMHEYDRAIAKTFLDSKSLHEVFTKLRLHEEALLKPLLIAAESYEQGKADADQLFASLSNSLKNSIYYQTWFDKWQNKELPPPHGDFGRAAFHCDKNLDPKFHCNGKERAAIIRASCMRLQQNYQRWVNGIQALFATPKGIPPSTLEQREKTRLLKPIIELFESGQDDAGFELFNQLDPTHQHGVYQYVWETFGCPRDFPGDFGAASFHSSLALEAERRCDVKKRIRALLCYLHSI
jgi:hypothetical protein